MSQLTEDRKAGLREKPSVFNDAIAYPLAAYFFDDYNETHYSYKAFRNISFHVLIPKEEVFIGKENAFVSGKWAAIMRKRWEEYSYHKGS